jgi:hypothetical protein
MKTPVSHYVLSAGLELPLHALRLMSDVRPDVQLDCIGLGTLDRRIQGLLMIWEFPVRFGFIVFFQSTNFCRFTAGPCLCTIGSP